MKKNSRLIMMIISLILVAQLIFAYSKANNERAKSDSQSEVQHEAREESEDI